MTDDIEQRAARRSWRSLVRHIPFHSMLTEHDVITQRGELIRIWRLDRTALPADARWLRQRYSAQRLPSQGAGVGHFSVWLHCLAGRDAAALEPSLPDPSTPTVPCNELYVSVLLRAGWRALAWRTLGKKTSHRMYANEIGIMNALSTAIADQLAEFAPHLLGDYFVAGQHHNEIFDFLSFLVNGAWTSRPVTAGPLYRTLACESLIQSTMRCGLVTCNGPQSAAHPFPDGVWNEPLRVPSLGRW
jgi:type IV secretion system protein VirB4